MRQEPGPAGRFFVNDLTGPLYILDPRTKSATTYLDFNGRGSRTGLFDKLTTDAGLASGFISFEFDPDYARNGRFYTIHLEEMALPGSRRRTISVRGLDVAGYTATAPIATPGSVDHEGVLIEWTDSNTRTRRSKAAPASCCASRSTAGSIRSATSRSIRPRGPAMPTGECCTSRAAMAAPVTRAAPTISIRSGWTRSSARSCASSHLGEHANDSTVSDNGRYRVPRDNPFVAVAGARPEIWAYGVRNPHRLGWHIEGGTAHLIASMIGWRIWETVC